MEKALSVKLDLDADSEQGFPGVVCRKCCHAVITFLDFAKSVDSGMAKLAGIVADRSRALQPASDLTFVADLDAAVAKDGTADTADVEIKHEPVESVKSQLKIKKAEEINSVIDDSTSEDERVTKPSLSESEPSSESGENLNELEGLQAEPEKPDENHELIEDEDGVETESTQQDFDPLTFEEASKDENLQDEDDEDVFDEELEIDEGSDPLTAVEGLHKEPAVPNEDNVNDNMNDVVHEDILSESSRSAAPEATSEDRRSPADFPVTSETSLTPATAESQIEIAASYSAVVTESGANANYAAEVSSSSLAKDYYSEGGDFRPMADYSASSSAMNSSEGYPMAATDYYDPTAANFDASGFSQETGYEQYGMHGQAYYSTAEPAADKVDPGLNGEAHFLMDATQQ
jgi:hypothetical protein